MKQRLRTKVWWPGINKEDGAFKLKFCHRFEIYRYISGFYFGRYINDVTLSSDL